MRGVSAPGRTAIPAVDVLLVEDDAVLVTLLTHALHLRSLTTDVAGDVLDATRLLARNIYRVVVIDVLLPGGTGFDIVDFIRTTGVQSTHVVAVTAADPEMLGRLDRDVVKTLFFKPLNVEHLASYVQTLAAQSGR